MSTSTHRTGTLRMRRTESICSTGDSEVATARLSSNAPERPRRCNVVQTAAQLRGGTDAITRRPLMLRVGDYHRAIGELDLVARPAEHHIGRGHYTRRATVGAEQPVT